MMDNSTTDSVSKVNLMCQKYKLEMRFSEQKISPNNKSFQIVLEIKKPNSSRILSYEARSNISKKEARKFASTKAINDDFVTKLGVDKKTFNHQKFLANSRKNCIKKDSTSDLNNNRHVSSSVTQSSASYTTYDIRTQANQSPNSTLSPTKPNNVPIYSDKASNLESRIINSTSTDPIYDLFLKIEKIGIKLNIEYIGSFNDRTLTIISINLGQIKSTGSGKSSLDAIRDAVEKLNPNCLKSIETDCFLDDEPNMKALIVLNKIRPKLDKDLDWKCLLCVEKVEKPMYLHECRFDGMISFGVDSDREQSRNICAYQILKNLRIKISQNRASLMKAIDELNVKVFDLENVLQSIEETVIPSSKKRKSNVIDDKIDLNDPLPFDFRKIVKKENPPNQI